MAQWSTFEEARAVVESYNKNTHPLSRTRLIALLVKESKPCPSPAWDPGSQYRVVLRNGRAIIEKRLPGGDWVEAAMDPPT